MTSAQRVSFLVLSLPIINKVNEVLFEEKDPREAVNELMLRDSKVEHMAVEWKE